MSKKFEKIKNLENYMQYTIMNKISADKFVINKLNCYKFNYL